MHCRKKKALHCVVLDKVLDVVRLGVGKAV